MEDIRKAASLNPLDGTIAKSSGQLIIPSKIKKLGDSVSSAQIDEVRTALERAIALNPGELACLSQIR